LPQDNNILGEHELSLYLRGDVVKYWDIPIVIGKETCIGELLEHILFPIVEDYLIMGDCWRCFKGSQLNASNLERCWHWSVEPLFNWQGSCLLY